MNPKQYPRNNSSATRHDTGNATGKRIALLLVTGLVVVLVAVGYQADWMGTWQSEFALWKVNRNHVRRPLPTMSDLAGTWLCPKAWISEFAGRSGPTTWIFDKKGTYVMKFKGVAYVEKGTWKLSGGDLARTSSSGHKLAFPFALSKDKKTFYFGERDRQVTFTKQ